MTRKARAPLSPKIINSVSKSLKSYRKQAGISQTDLAIKADLTMLTVANLERRQATNMTLQTALSLAKATKTPITKMLGIAA